VAFSETLGPAFSGIFRGTIVIGLLLTMSISLIVNAVFVSMRKAVFSLYASLILNGARLVFLFIFKGSGIQVILGSTFIGYFFSILIGLYFFMPKLIEGYQFKTTFRLEKVKKMFSFSFGNYLSIIFQQLARSLVVPMSAEILGEAQGAYAYMVWLLAAFVFAPGEAMGRSVLVESVHSPNDTRKLILRSIAISVGVTLFIAAICFFGSAFILQFFGDGYVTYAEEFFKIMILSSPLVVINYVFFAYFRLRKRIKIIIIASALLSIISLTVPYFGLDQFGLNAIGYGWVTANIILGFYFFMLVYNKIKFMGNH
jgi:O-antigen/teichoic acid export membrane protein